MERDSYVARNAGATRGSELEPPISSGKVASLPPTTSDRKGFGLGRIVFVLASVGIVGFVGLRVRDAVATKKDVEVKRTQAAQVAAENAAKPVSGHVVRGTPQKWQASVPFEGSLTPVREADLGFKTGGRIRKIGVSVGQKVSAGTVLGTLDSSEAAAQADAADSQVRMAEAQLALADDGFKRTHAMVTSGGASEVAGVQAEHGKTLATAQLDGARAQRALARASLENHVLAAPFAGSVTKAPSGAGAVVGAGIPQFHIADLSTLKLVGTVSENDASLVAVGAPVVLDVDGRSVTAKVIAVLGTVDAATRRVPVEAEVQNDATRPLLAGSFVRAAVRGGSSIDVVRLPHDALRPGSQDEIMVVQDGLMHARRVQFVVANDGSLLVRSGVSAKEDVLLSPNAEARDGDKIVIAPEPEKTR